MLDGGEKGDTSSSFHPAWLVRFLGAGGGRLKYFDERPFFEAGKSRMSSLWNISGSLEGMV